MRSTSFACRKLHTKRHPIGGRRPAEGAVSNHDERRGAAQIADETQYVRRCGYGLFDPEGPLNVCTQGRPYDNLTGHVRSIAILMCGLRYPFLSDRGQIEKILLRR